MLGLAVQWVKDNSRREDGQAMAEYGIILALIAAVVIVTLVTLGTKIEAAFTTIVGQL
jgi:pilus assembly protein Flp/PilA